MSQNTSLYAKIAQVMANIDIPKTGKNEFHGYDYIESDVLAERLGKAMAQAGLVAIPSIIGMKREGDITRVKMEVKVVDIASGESVTCTWYGEGQDKQDKGLYKAITGGYKYFLLKLFMVGAGGEDPEKDDGQSSAVSGRPSAVSRQRARRLATGTAVRSHVCARHAGKMPSSRSSSTPATTTTSPEPPPSSAITRSPMTTSPTS